MCGTAGGRIPRIAGAGLKCSVHEEIAMRCQLIAAAALAILLPASLAGFGGRNKSADCCDDHAAHHAHGWWGDCCDSCGGHGHDWWSGDCCPPAAPAVQTVRVCRMVPTWVDQQVTTHRTEWRDENYTAYRCEVVPETRTRCYTVYNHVKHCEMKPVTRCVQVPCVEYRTEYETRKSLRWVTETKTCYEKKWYCTTKCVEDKPGFFARLCRKKDDCCDPCPKYKVETEWHSCKVPVCKEVRKLRCVEECVPVCKQVCTYRTEHRTEMVPCVTWKCVPETRTETYTVCCTKVVPYTACRKVPVCVPCTTTVKVCKMVPTWVDVQVPACDPCCGGHHVASPGCCN
jgi:hypothetical protein